MDGTKHYALYQSGYSVIATGATEAECRERSKEWLRAKDATGAKLLLGTGTSEEEGELYVRPCTAKLVQEVAAREDVPYVVDGTGWLDVAE